MKLTRNFYLSIYPAPTFALISKSGSPNPTSIFSLKSKIRKENEFETHVMMTSCRTSSSSSSESSSDESDVSESPKKLVSVFESTSSTNSPSSSDSESSSDSSSSESSSELSPESELKTV